MTCFDATRPERDFSQRDFSLDCISFKSVTTQGGTNKNKRQLVAVLRVALISLPFETDIFHSLSEVNTRHKKGLPWVL